MRHKKHHASLGVTAPHRKSMMANMAASLITHGRIKTTFAKAKALRPFIEKVITKAKKAALKTEKKDAIHLRRLALADVVTMEDIREHIERISEVLDRLESGATPAESPRSPSNDA
jgi:ribosomal protein L17